MAPSLWQPTRDDWRDVCLVVLLPLVLAVMQLAPGLRADPLYYAALMTVDAGSTIQRGLPFTDLNNGFQTQALGHLAASSWLSGEVPWWNPYNGVGMPLAAEYQPSAFFPLIFLVLLPHGTIALQAALEMLAGLGTYALLRQLGLTRAACIAGGVLYALNGTFAWLAHGPAMPVAFLPWMLLGIERAYAAARLRRHGGWRLLAAAMALNLLAGFPETAYVNGLMALCWAVFRSLQVPADVRIGYAARIAAGGLAGLMLAAPQVVSFLEYLPDSEVGEHANVHDATLFGPNVFASLISPYVFGPVFGFAEQWRALYPFWGGMGGYASIALVATAIFGFVARRDALSTFMLAWTIAVLAASFGLQPFHALWNLIPGIAQSFFCRYSQPTWELALVVLAARGLDALLVDGANHSAWRAMVAATALGLIAAAGYMAYLWPHIQHVGTLDKWIAASSVWALVTWACVVSLLQRARVRTATALLAFEAAILCGVPMLSNPRHGSLDLAAVSFLRENLGLQRYFTLEHIAPNYGAFFSIAQVNHNYLPVPRIWADHVKAKLNPKWTDVSVFNGMMEGSAQALRENVREYEALGVKYVVANRGQDPLVGVIGVRRVYEDSILTIFELPEPSPYFEARGCQVEPQHRTSVRVQCEAPSTLIRRELYFPQWRAAVNDASATIEPHGRIFQQVALAKGTNEVRFSYAPPNIAWAWLAATLGFAALFAPTLLLRRKHQ